MSLRHLREQAPRGRMDDGWASRTTVEIDPPSWTLTELPAVPATERVGRPGSRWTGLLLALVAGVVSTGFTMTVVFPRVTDRGAELEHASGIGTAGSQLASPLATGDRGSGPATDMGEVAILSPRDGAIVGPGLVEVRLRLDRPTRGVSVAVVVGSTVVGRVDALVPAGGLLGVDVPVLGPGADVPARIEIRSEGDDSGRLVAAWSSVTLAGAPGIGVWRTRVEGRESARTISVVGYGALVVGNVRVDLRASARRIAGSVVAIAADPGGAGVPFGMGRWSATLAVPAIPADHDSGRDGRSLIVEITWPSSAAGPAGSTAAVVTVGDGRGARR